MTRPVPSSSERLSLEDASTAALVREALNEAKELVRVEIELATNEVEMAIVQAKRAAIGIGVALAAGVLLLCALAMALIFGLGGTVLSALAVAGVLAIVACVAGWFGYVALPRKPLERTRQRLKVDVGRLREHVV